MTKKTFFILVLPILLYLFSACTDKVVDMEGTTWVYEQSKDNGDVSRSILSFFTGEVTEMQQTLNNNALLENTIKNGKYIYDEGSVKILWPSDSIESLTRENEGSKKSKLSSNRPSADGNGYVNYTWTLQ